MNAIGPVIDVVLVVQISIVMECCSYAATVNFAIWKTQNFLIIQNSDIPLLMFVFYVLKVLSKTICSHLLHSLHIWLGWRLKGIGRLDQMHIWSTPNPSGRRFDKNIAQFTAQEPCVCACVCLVNYFN